MVSKIKLLSAVINNKISKQCGFTLIELSIVLVIIGLLVGGVLVGTDLIKSAGNRAYVSQLQSYNAAVNSFKLKYNCLPGDCANATDYGFTGNGNANAMVSGLVSGSASVDYSSTPIVTSYMGWLNPEANYFWGHLRNALLIPEFNNPLVVADGSGAGYSLPPAKNDGTGILATGWNGKHYYRSGAIATRAAGDVIWSTNLSPADSAYIFEKMGGTTITTTSTNGYYPDGLGKEKVMISSSSNTWCYSGTCYDTLFFRFMTRGTGGANADYCIDTSVTPAYFNLKNPKKLCALIIQADF